MSRQSLEGILQEARKTDREFRVQRLFKKLGQIALWMMVANLIILTFPIISSFEFSPLILWFLFTFIFIFLSAIGASMIAIIPIQDWNYAERVVIIALVLFMIFILISIVSSSFFLFF